MMPDIIAISKIALEITDDLFRNVDGDEAKRLVLELPDGRDGGGWCKDAVLIRIINILRKLETDDAP